MNYDFVAFIHLATICPRIFIGAWLLAQPKGNKSHKSLGLIYMLLMVFSCLVSLGMPAKVGPQLLLHFGFIHVLSVVALVSVVIAFKAIRQGNVKVHKRAMIGLYIGGILVAGSFTLMPGRLLHHWIIV